MAWIICHDRVLGLWTGANLSRRGAGPRRRQIATPLHPGRPQRYQPIVGTVLPNVLEFHQDLSLGSGPKLGGTGAVS
jgi:hypothetical protein